MKRERGRPEKPPEERKSVMVPIRLTTAEKAQIDAVADGNVSEWARGVLLKAARRKSRS